MLVSAHSFELTVAVYKMAVVVPVDEMAVVVEGPIVEIKAI